MREIDESDPSQEERIHEYLCEEATKKLIYIEGDLEVLRRECETIYVQTGNERAKYLADGLKKLEDSDA